MDECSYEGEIYAQMVRDSGAPILLKGHHGGKFEVSTPVSRQVLARLSYWLTELAKHARLSLTRLSACDALTMNTFFAATTYTIDRLHTIPDAYTT